MQSNWPESPGELERLQARIAARAAPDPWSPARDPVVGAVFAATRRGVRGRGAARDPAWVAAVAMSGQRVAGWAVIRGVFGGPYQAGLLALREGELLERAARALQPRPEVLLVNGTGADHPRAAGLAIHLGWVLDMPTIGITDRLLDSGRGAARAGPGRGVWVHAGWRTTTETAIALLAPVFDQRTPAPLREARRLARTARAQLG